MNQHYTYVSKEEVRATWKNIISYDVLLLTGITLIRGKETLKIAVANHAYLRRKPLHSRRVKVPACHQSVAGGGIFSPEFFLDSLPNGVVDL